MATEPAGSPFLPTGPSFRHLAAVSNSPRVTAVIFDMDGVLTDSEPLINEAAVSMFREKGHAVHPDDFIPFVGTGEDRYLGGVAEKHGIALDLPEAKRRTYENYLALVPEKLRAFPGAVEVVRACRAAGLRIVVASSADRIKIEANLNKIGLPADRWDAVISGEDVVRKKPAPDIFLAAAQKLNVSPGACVVVEDAVNGVAAAKAAGMRCVAVAQTFPASRLENADLVRNKLEEVSLTDLTGEHPADAAGHGLPLAPPPSSPVDLVGTRVLRPAGPWGFWATLGFAVLIAIGFLAAQLMAVIVFALVGTHGKGGGPLMAEFEHNGSLLAWATVASTPVAFGLCWLFAWLRRHRTGFSARQYLGLVPVSRRTLGQWCLAVVALVLISDVVTVVFGKAVVPDVMVEIYRAVDFLPVLWLAIIVLAPIGEEVVFRGFLLPGFSHTFLGNGGAVVLTSATWALMHFQYDYHGILIIFVAGLLLGAARVQTGSLYPCIAMHALQNFISTIETVVMANR
jgi:HAD superfamily hydrolase (TIGR01509 family)